MEAVMFAKRFFYVCAGIACITLACHTAVRATAQPRTAATNEKNRPGDEQYVPSKLEWAALQIDLLVGRGFPSPGQPEFITCLIYPAGDGTTVICSLTYSSAMAAGTLEGKRELVRVAFEVVKKRSGW